MTIVNSTITSDRLQRTGTRKIKEEFVDQFGIIHPIQYSGVDADYDADARLASDAILVDEALVETEIQEGMTILINGGDPLYFEESPNNFQKITPKYQTWEQLANGVTVPFMQSENQLDLLPLQNYIVRMTTNNKKLIWGMTNQEVSAFNADVQTAIDTQISLDSYVPWFDEDGVLKE